jgi:acyl dehydratase
VPLNQALKGKEYGEITFHVDRDHVVRFADAIGDPNPVYRDPEAAKALGYPEQVAPPTFLTVLQIMTSGQAVVDPELGLNYALVVHGEQEYEWERPVHVGETLRARPRIADIYARGPNEFLVIETEIADENGGPIGVSRSTLLSRGTAGGT